MLKSSCFEFFADWKYRLFLSQKVDGNEIFTDYWKVPVLNFSELENAFFFEPESWWKDGIYLVFLSFPWYSRTWEIWLYVQRKAQLTALLKWLVQQSRTFAFKTISSNFNDSRVGGAAKRASSVFVSKKIRQSLEKRDSGKFVKTVFSYSEVIPTPAVMFKFKGKEAT